MNAEGVNWIGVIVFQPLLLLTRVPPSAPVVVLVPIVTKTPQIEKGGVSSLLCSFHEIRAAVAVVVAVVAVAVVAVVVREREKISFLLFVHLSDQFLSFSDSQKLPDCCC